MALRTHTIGSSTLPLSSSLKSARRNRRRLGSAQFLRPLADANGDNVYGGSEECVAAATPTTRNPAEALARFLPFLGAQRRPYAREPACRRGTGECLQVPRPEVHIL